MILPTPFYLQILEIIGASSSTINRILVNNNPKSSRAWIFQVISCFFSGLLAYEKSLFIWTVLESWAFFLSIAIFICRWKNLHKETQTRIQLYSAAITGVVCIIMLTYSYDKPKIFWEFSSSLCFMIGLVLLIKNNRYGHLLFSMGNIILGLLFLASGMKMFFSQQIFSALVVICTFYGYRINFTKVRLDKTSPPGNK